jgi:hypothetical protein
LSVISDIQSIYTETTPETTTKTTLLKVPSQQVVEKEEKGVESRCSNDQELELTPRQSNQVVDKKEIVGLNEELSVGSNSIGAGRVSSVLNRQMY